MSADCFLKIDGIQGESTDPKHNDEIMVLSWSWSETQAVAAAPPGGTGKVSMQDFHFSKAVDTASPKLMLACATGASRILTLNLQTNIFRCISPSEV